MTLRKLGKKGQFVCDLVKKSEGGGPCFFFREGVSISKGGHVSSFKRGGAIGMGGPLALGGGGVVGGLRIGLRPHNWRYSPISAFRLLCYLCPKRSIFGQFWPFGGHCVDILQSQKYKLS